MYKLSWPMDAIRMSKEPKVVERHSRIYLRGGCWFKIYSKYVSREGGYLLYFEAPFT